MKRIAFILGAMLLVCQPVLADEGMWLLPLIQKLNSKDMKAAGLKLSAEDIYSINKSSLKDAIVQFGRGCTGEIVSDEGLLLTNHHCGYGTIQALSSVEHNYLMDGFFAMSRNEEIPAPGLTVTFLERIEDVTNEVEAYIGDCKDESERVNKVQECIAKIKERIESNEKGVSALISELYGGNTYYLFVYKIYKDIRFVGAPPSSIGKFGADTDNWMWPRHTCDFSMFRVYADKNGEPAEYSPENKPLRVKRSLRINLNGVKEGDFNMIMGFPGTTTRFMTSAEVKEQEELINNIGIECRTIRQDAMLEDMLRDPKVQLQYASKYASSSNAWKKWQGMNETFAKLNVAERRAEEEKKFTEWCNQDAERKAKYGNALQDIEQAISGRKDSYRLYRYISEAYAKPELSEIAGKVGLAISGKKASTAEIETLVKDFYDDYNVETDKKVTKAMLKVFAKNVTKEDRPKAFELIEQSKGETLDEKIDYFVEVMFHQSLFTSQEKVLEALHNDPQILFKDIAVYYYNSVATALKEARTKMQEYNLQYNRGHRNYIGGIMQMNGDKPMYPDATLTMRLTYGNVGGYRPKDGVYYSHYTTLEGVMEKEDPNNWEFIVPEKLKALYKAKDYGRYAENGELHTCFLNNLDITGGNSGSPVLNAKGELIGLAFDGNWESMSGDVIFEPQLQRCICVDIRYVMFIIDKFGGAGYLLDEMKITQNKRK